MSGKKERALEAAEREWAVDALRDLIARLGCETFLYGPLVPPARRLFPDRFDETWESVAIILRRALALGGIEEPWVHILDRRTLGGVWMTDRPGVAFERLGPAGEHVFSIVGAGRAPLVLPGLTPAIGLALTAARAQLSSGGPFRGASGITEAAFDPRLGHVCAVYHGFGLAACRPDTTPSDHNRGVSDEEVRAFLRASDGLRPRVRLFLVALQLAMRGRPRDLALARRMIPMRQLPRLWRWRRQITRERAIWLARLGIENHDMGFGARLPEAPAEPPGKHTMKREAAGVCPDLLNHGLPVRLKEGTLAAPLGALGAVAGAGFGFLAAGTVGPAAAALAAGAGLSAALAGRRHHYRLCMGFLCYRRIEGDPHRCPHCGGEFRDRDWEDEA